MDTLAQLHHIRDRAGRARTLGLPDDVIARFAERHPRLRQAVADALAAHDALASEFPDLLALDEPAQIFAVQRRLVNFYTQDAVNPYMALAARGPWIVTTCGAVIHDSGGYGMLGLGHAPERVLEAMSGPHVMANIMTASAAQLRLVRALENEIGRTRGGCPFDGFLCLNSGSEAVTVGARISDVNARLMTDPGGRHEGRPIRRLSLKGSFHGRTDRPAQFSDSTRGSYLRYLATFRDDDRLWTVPPNDVAALEAVFQRAEREGEFIEAFFIEPVMGEGNPGLAITPEFYRACRRLTREHGALLLVDSIQAGLRAVGNLSIVDYPGFEDCEAPDLETYSKALNAGQFPLSVLALNRRAVELFRVGTYGNTMTTNPRALDVAVAALGAMTPELRENIRARGAEFLDGLHALAAEHDGVITAVQGTGLLLSCELAEDLKCYGEDSVEEWLRLHGIGVIHGGRNSLRFTPHFAITSEEISLILDRLREALLQARRVASSRQ